jgi:probable rRNA maturation factor
MPAEVRNETTNPKSIDAVLRQLETLINECLVKMARPEAHVDLTLVDEEDIHRLNRDYRGVDSVTDVLSFPMEEGEEEPEYIRGDGEPELLGDIVICLARAEKQAEEYNHSLRRELGYLSVHGLLHLLGFDHDTPVNKERMREKEETLLGDSWGRD